MNPEFSHPETSSWEHHETPQRLLLSVETLIKPTLESFTVEGREHIENFEREHEPRPYIIASSHFSNIDAPAAVKALGDRLDIQVTAQSILFDSLAQKTMMRIGGKESFSPLSYELTETDRAGVFNPDDFDALAQTVEKGKTPWMAIHPFPREEQGYAMLKGRTGAVYLAQRTGAAIIPAALEIQGLNVGLEGKKQVLGGILNRQKGTYHIGEPMILPEFDVSIIADVIRKQENNETLTSEERKAFLKVRATLKEQTDIVARRISEMLPEKQRGYYSSENV